MAPMSSAKSNFAVRRFELALAPPRPRVDLRTGVLAGAFVAAPRAPLDDWLAALIAARDTWEALGRAQPLSAPAPDYLFEDGQASRLDALLRGAGFAMRSVTIEVEETEIVACEKPAMTAIERLRARGWGVALRCAPDCPLALGSRGRSVFSEVLAEAPDDLSPALAMADPDDRPITRRVRAAQAFGLVTTAVSVKSPAHAGLLIALGFDRGEGPGYPV
jgi:hypothetical protein